MKTRPDYRVVIIGAGFSGMGAAIKLQDAGIRDYVIFEKAPEFGGTWWFNTYPWVACDVPALRYSYSFAPNFDWKRWYAEGEQIEDYLKYVAQDNKLGNHTVFNTEVVRSYWDEAERLWHVVTKDCDGVVLECTAQFVISGVGALHVPSVPEFEGKDTFGGAQFHSAEWDHSVDITGKRVAVVGTGASSVQIVPGIVRDVGQLKVFQRTPVWLAPRKNGEVPKWLRRSFNVFPPLRLAFRQGFHLYQEFVGEGMTKHPSLLNIIKWLHHYNLRSAGLDREMRDKLTPKYQVGCKRVGASSFYPRAFTDPKTELVTDNIVRITEKGIVTVDADGNETESEVDVIVWCTGFHVTDSFEYMGEVIGLDGVSLQDRWRSEGMMTHLGITMADLPNWFFLLGPNTGLGHNSVIIMIEYALGYIIQAIKAVDELGVAALVPKRSAQDAWNESIQKRMARTVQISSLCQGWYFDKFRKNRVTYPGHTGKYGHEVRRLNLDEYVLID